MASSRSILRELLLAVQVLDGVDLELHDSGIVLTGGVPVVVPWSALRGAVGPAPLRSAQARARVVRWLRMRRQLGDLPLALLGEQLRPVGLPVGHAAHPGQAWVSRRVLGEALDLGPGVLGLDPAAPDEVAVVPADLWCAAGIDPAVIWPQCAERLEQMGALAARRWSAHGSDVLRPMGGCDVVTLLGARNLRRALADSAGGMCPVVAPMRTRGWTQLSRLDPAFAAAAALATEPGQRGFPRPVLVTQDELVLAADGPRALLGALDGLPAHDRRSGAFPG